MVPRYKRFESPEARANIKCIEVCLGERPHTSEELCAPLGLSKAMVQRYLRYMLDTRVIIVLDAPSKKHDYAHRGADVFALVGVGHDWKPPVYIRRANTFGRMSHAEFNEHLVMRRAQEDRLKLENFKPWRCEFETLFYGSPK